MRLWVSHDERRPQPEPVATNDRLAYQVGIGLWLVALVVVGVLVLVGMPVDGPVLLATVVIGVILGLAGIAVVSRTRSR